MIGAITAGLYGTGVPPVTNSYESIQTYTVGSGGTSSISFSSIPSTFKHLQLRVIGRTTEVPSNSAAMNFTFNGDTGTNYAQHRIWGNGTTAGSNGYASIDNASTVLGVIPSSGSGANCFGAVVVDILDYANTNKYKTVRLLGGIDDNSGDGARSRLTFSSSLWQSTSAINSINLTVSVANWAQYSQIALYGIKG